MLRWNCTFGLLALVITSAAQSYGLLLGAAYNDLYAAGAANARTNGISMGVFLPFYVNDRLVLRAEAGGAAFGERMNEDTGSPTRYRTEVSLTALGRYYLGRKASLSLGIQGIRILGTAGTLTEGRTAYPIQRTDLCLLTGLAYRWTDRIETGVRFGQGLLPAAELPQYGTARRRYAHLTLSYLLRSDRAPFAERRKWRSGLALANRY